MQKKPANAGFLLLVPSIIKEADSTKNVSCSANIAAAKNAMPLAINTHFFTLAHYVLL
jgi:hypothetical protein